MVRSKRPFDSRGDQPGELPGMYGTSFGRLERGPLAPQLRDAQEVRCCGVCYVRMPDCPQINSRQIHQVEPTMRQNTANDVLWKICAAGECWMWTGWYDSRGYGRVRWEKRAQQAHRVVYEIIKGEKIPKELTSDHLCRNHWCVNPDHIEPVTNRENILRGFNRAAMFARRERCPKGHEFTVRGATNPTRICRTCTNERVRNRNLLRRSLLGGRKGIQEKP